GAAQGERQVAGRRGSEGHACRGQGQVRQDGLADLDDGPGAQGRPRGGRGGLRRLRLREITKGAGGAYPPTLFVRSPLARFFIDRCRAGRAAERVDQRQNALALLVPPACDVVTERVCQEIGRAHV